MFFIPSVCFCGKTKKVFDILTNYKHYELPLAILSLLRQPRLLRDACLAHQNAMWQIIKIIVKQLFAQLQGGTEIAI